MMKIAIGYPQLESKKGTALLAQNRQFQWAKTPWTAYPIIPAYAATMLKNAGYEILWLDGINKQMQYKKWESKLFDFNPDILFLETKTPVIKKHWQIIEKLKKINKQLTIILAGDHVTARPKETLNNSQADYILTGGDYDYLLLSVVKHIEKGKKLKPGIWYKKNRKILNTGKFQLKKDLSNLPLIDRELTNWKTYAYKNSNYRSLPGTYTMFSRDCWWGKCTFCSWPANLYPQCRTISVDKAIKEVEELVKKYSIKEIMDDSGTFPVGNWLNEFCEKMIKKGLNKKVRINCNMRFNSNLTKKDYQMMRKAGFRFLLYGLESANQKTLDKINKGLKVEQIEPNLKNAKKAGLNPHVTVMIGYPWEEEKDIENTYQFFKDLVQKKLIDSWQTTIVIPYPGTPLFKEANEKNWLKTKDWGKYDMRQPIVKTDLKNKELKEYIRKFYSLVFTPQWMLMKIQYALTNWDVFKYYLRFVKRYFSKQLDFR